MNNMNNMKIYEIFWISWIKKWEIFFQNQNVEIIWLNDLLSVLAIITCFPEYIVPSQ